MSDNILLYYVQKLNLTGIETPLPLFRYDNDLAADDVEFWSVMAKLVKEEIKDELIEYIN